MEVSEVLVDLEDQVGEPLHHQGWDLHYFFNCIGYRLEGDIYHAFQSHNHQDSNHSQLRWRRHDDQQVKNIFLYYWLGENVSIFKNSTLFISFPRDSLFFSEFDF